MGLPRGKHRALNKPPKLEAAKRYAECLRLLHRDTPPTPEELARIEREAREAPYRNGKRQGELGV